MTFLLQGDQPFVNAGRRHTGTVVSRQPPFGRRIRRAGRWDAAVTAKSPSAGTIVLNSLGKWETFQNVLRLPLSDDGQRVDNVVTVSEIPQGLQVSRHHFEQARR